MFRKFLTIIVFLGFSQVAYGQECSAVLDDAKSEFAAGHLEVISDLLKDCLQGNNFTQEQKIDAYRLLTITYLYLDDPYQAERSFMDLLDIDHEYRILPTDPVELQYLSKKFITTPIISFTAKAGANYTTVSVLHRNSTSAEIDNSWSYTPTVGFNILAGMDLHFNKIVSLNLELEFGSRSFIYRDTLFASEPQALEQTRLFLHGSLPVSLKFTYPGVKYYPYVYGGYSPSYTFQSKGKSIRDPDSDRRIEGTALNLQGRTKDFSHSLIFGVGVKRRFKYNYVLIDFRYRLGMTNMLQESNQFDFTNPDIKEDQFTYLLSSDDFTTSGFELTVGYTIPQYRVRAKNTVTIQTVISNIFSKKKKDD